MSPTQLLQTVPRKVNAILKTIDEPNEAKFGALQIDLSSPEKFIRVTDEQTKLSHAINFIGDPDDAENIFFENPGFEDMTISLDGFVHFEKLVYDELSKVQAEFADLPNSIPSMGFFRHVRPLVYDPISHTMTRHPKGGVSFYIAPIADRSYDYWIYVCPLDTRFSARQAVHTLRQNSGNVAPWGNIALGDEESIINKLVNNMETAPELPSNIPNMVKSILAGNEIEIRAMKDAEEVIKSASGVYENADPDIVHYVDEYSADKTSHGIKTIFTPSL